MAYNPPTLRPKAQTNNFSNLRTDGSRNVMQFGNYPQTIDNTGTPVISPTTVNTATTLVIPTGAVQVTVCSVTNPVRVSEDSTASAYFAVPAGVPWTFDLANLTNIYLTAASSTVVSFYFSIV